MNESGASAAGLGINGSQPVDNISSHGKNGSKAAHTTKDSNVMIQNKRKGLFGKAISLHRELQGKTSLLPTAFIRRALPIHAMQTEPMSPITRRLLDLMV